MRSVVLGDVRKKMNNLGLSVCLRYIVATGGEVSRLCKGSSGGGIWMKYASQLLDGGDVSIFRLLVMLVGKSC